MFIPDKCVNCNHAVVEFENVHEGYMHFSYVPVVRCNCFPVNYKVGTVCSEVYCQNKQKSVF